LVGTLEAKCEAIMVVTGWRGWVIGAAAFAGITVILALIAFVLLGVAITAGSVAMIVVPVAVGVAVLASLVQLPRRR